MAGGAGLGRGLTSLGGRFGKKRKASSEDMSLNITSMADIFTIILVFLLKSFSSDASIDPGGVSLPQLREGGSKEVPIALKLELAPDRVLLDGRAVASLESFRFAPEDLLADSGASKSLEAAFAEERQKQLHDAAARAPAGEQPKADTRLTVLADRKTPYTTLKAVLASATLHGYTDFKLVVIKEE